MRSVTFAMDGVGAVVGTSAVPDPYDRGPVQAAPAPGRAGRYDAVVPGQHSAV